MASPETPRRLIVNADDFGRSRSINAAVIRAHREGILTTASLMVNGDAVEEAVELARENPKLGVGLHLALVCGRAALPPAEIPGLVDGQGNFTDNAVAAGFRYFFNGSLRPQLEREIDQQFENFRQTGLHLDHVNGHLHMHLHPVVFGWLMQRQREYGITHLRLTRDPFWLNTRLASGQWFYRASHAVVYQVLSAVSRGRLQAAGIRFTPHVFGLLQNARVDEAYVQKLLPVLPAGDSELYSHPSLDEFKNELDALVSAPVRALVERQNIRLIRYQDL